MKKVAIEEVEPAATNSPADVVRVLSPALETDGLALNYFEVDPAESLGYAYHRHLDQEEVFYVQAGRVTFETEAGDVEVEAGEVIRFEPGEFQLGRNFGDERAHVLAIGAPRESKEIEYLLECPTCEATTIHVPQLTERPKAILVRCTECDTRTDEVPL
jgi:mannose-6-phosphate isomerase-like protein (cupin superfamily)